MEEFFSLYTMNCQAETRTSLYLEPETCYDH